MMATTITMTMTTIIVFVNHRVPVMGIFHIFGDVILIITTVATSYNMGWFYAFVTV